MQKMMLSAFADEYDDAFDMQIEGLKKLNIPQIELRFADKINCAALTEAQAESVHEKLQNAGIRVSAIGSPLGKISLDDPFELHLTQTKRVCELANLLGAKNIRVFSFYPGNQTGEAFKNGVYERLAAMLEIADAYGVRFCHENEAKIYGETDDKCLELLQAFSGRLGCVFDMGNFVLDGVNPLEAYRKLKPYITYFHIKDALAAGAIVPAGKGEARIAEILTDFAQTATEPFVATLEPHLQTFSGKNALVGKAFTNPYQFPDAQTAFVAAAQALRATLGAQA